MKKIVAIIPARGGSKGIPRKNIKLLKGKPLIAYSIDAARNAPSVDRVLVTTDDKEIAAVAKKHGASVIMRPGELAEDKTPMDPVLEHALNVLSAEGYVPDAVLLLQPTSPLRTAEHVQGAIEKFLASDNDSLISVFKITNNRHEIGGDDFLVPTFTKNKNRNERPIATFENGAIYISKTHLIKEGRIRGDKIGYYEMDQYSSIDIDTPLDFETVKKLLE